MFPSPQVLQTPDTAAAFSSLEFFTNPHPFCKYHFSPTQPTPHTLNSLRGFVDAPNDEGREVILLNPSLLLTLFSECGCPVALQALRLLAWVDPGFVGLMAHAILETILKRKNTKLQMQSKVRTLVELWLDHSEGTLGEIIQGRRPEASVPCSLYWTKECV